MCDPVPSHPDNNYACIQCGSQVEYEGGLICDACQRRLKGQPWPALKAEQEFPVEPSPALPPTGAAPSNPAGPVSLDMAAVELRAAAASLDPGLQSDRWSLHQQQFGGPHAGKLKKVGQPLDPKDLMINVGFVDARCKVILTHKPTRLFCEEEGPADQKEAIHSRLYGELKRKVENLQANSPTCVRALVDSQKFKKLVAAWAHAGLFDQDKAWVKVLDELGELADRQHKITMEAMASVAEARTVPEPQSIANDRRWREVVRRIGFRETGMADGPVWTIVLPTPRRAGNTDENFVAAIDEAILGSSQVHPDSALPSKVQQ